MNRRFRPPYTPADYAAFAIAAVLLLVAIYGAFNGDSADVVTTNLAVILLLTLLALDGPYSRLGRDIVRAANEDRP